MLGRGETPLPPGKAVPSAARASVSPQVCRFLSVTGAVRADLVPACGAERQARRGPGQPARARGSARVRRGLCSLAPGSGGDIGPDP